MCMEIDKERPECMGGGGGESGGMGGFDLKMGLITVWLLTEIENSCACKSMHLNLSVCMCM